MNTTEAINALKECKRIFASNHITFWLEKGTVLGAIRHGELVPWDNDIDLGVWMFDNSKIARCRKDFFTTDFELYYINGHYALRNKKSKKHIVCLLPAFLSKGNQYRAEFLPPLTYLMFALCAPDYASKDLEYIETVVGNWTLPQFFKKMLIFLTKKIKREKREILISLLWRVMLNLHVYKKKYISSAQHVEQLSTVSFYQQDFLIPSNIEQYLVCLFGEGWRVPRHKGKLVTTWRGKKVPMNSNLEYIRE